MVEPMAKLTLLFRPAGQDRLLAELQEFGLVHVEQQKVESSSETSRLAARVAHIVQDQGYLRSRAQEHEVPPEIEDYEGRIEDLVRTIDQIRSRIDAFQTERGQLRRELAVAERWGEFDPDRVAELQEHGLEMVVHSAPYAVAEEVSAQLADDEARSFVPLFEDGTRMFFAVVGPLEEKKEAIPGSEERLPERSVSALRHRMEEIDAGLAGALADIDELLPYREALSAKIVEMRNELSYKLVKASVKDASDGELFVLTGWIPERERGRLEEFLDKEEAVYLLDNPSSEEQVPVKLRNGRYARLFEPILNIFSLPNYRELDPTPFFAPFYTIFFGLCVADLGYGVLLLVVAAAALFVIKRKSMKPLIYLALILSVSVAVFGFLLNDFFGLKITDLARPHSAIAQAVIFGNIHSAMLLAITLGFVQIIFAYVLRAINQTRAHGAAGAMKPIGIAVMLLGVVIAALHGLGSSFKVGPIPFGALAGYIPYAGLVGYVLVGLGLLLLLFFNSLDKKVLVRPFMGLWELYELLTTVPGYILSYLRLFALGLSGALLGETTVRLATMVGGGGHSPVKVLLMIVVLLFGSSVNLAIGLLSAFVHSLRLTFVEFYNSLGFKGGGVKYEPFELKS